MIDVRPESDRLQPLLAAMFDGQLTDEQAAELRDMLSADPAVRRRYVRQVATHGMLQWAMGGKTTAGPGILGDDFQAAITSSNNIQTDNNSVFPPPSPLPSLSPLPSSLSPPFVGGPVFSYMVATLVLCAMLLSAWAYKITLSDGRFVDNSKPSVTPGEQMEFVGRITGMADCKWSDPDSRPYAGSYVPLRRKYELTSGLLEITYTSGAKVILEGPCAYTVDSKTGGYLGRGKLTARVDNAKPRVENHKSSSLIPHPSSFFSVTTPTAIVTDLGTEFGVEVDGNGNTQSHVFEGTVRFQVLERPGYAEQSVVLSAGQTAKCVKGERVAVASNTAEKTKYVRCLSNLHRSDKEVPTAYVATVLEIGEDCDCRAIGINDAGQVIGVVKDVSGKQTAFIHDGGRKKARMLFGPNGEQSFAQCVNISGLVAGRYTAGGGDAKEIACIWDSEGKCVRLDGAGKYVSSEAWGINDAGAASGFGVSADGSMHSFVYTASGGLADIGGLGGALSKATEINDAGNVAGFSTIASGQDERAYLFIDGKMTDLGAADGLTSRAFALNNRDIAVGYYSTILGHGGARAFIYRGDSKNPAIKPIASLGMFSIAFDINDAGQVVGRCWNGIDMIENYRAFVHANGKMHDLNELADLPNGCVLRQARGINNAGQIAAWGTNESGRRFGCLLTPVSAADLPVQKGGNRKP